MLDDDKIDFLLQQEGLTEEQRQTLLDLRKISPPWRLKAVADPAPDKNAHIEEAEIVIK